MKPQGRLHLGAAYYPEHWPQDRWSEDIRLMQEAGFTVVRMAEFAWSTLEPEAGCFQFDWLEQVIEQLAAAGIQTVLGTPTAAPPAWLTAVSPHILAIDENGRSIPHGNRWHYCVNSAPFHQAVQRIVGALAARFGNNQHVIGWQIDNEYNRVCYCDHCHAEFHQFLCQKFTTLDELNRCWATRYWSQTYTDWGQISLPIGPHNPGLMLAFRQSVTTSYDRFQKLQIDSLRPHLPKDVWITHNFMGWYDGYNHYDLAADLDFVSWDMYVQGDGQHDYLQTAVSHDLMRGLKQRNFWLMETQPGHVNWQSINSVLPKMAARALAWQAIGHGADGILYWQWRSALGGQEQYHGTLIDASGQPHPFYKEVSQLGIDLTAVSHLLVNTQPIKAKVALLHDYDSHWSIEAQPHHQGFDYDEHFNHYYRPLARRNIPLDVISADTPLDGYRLVIAPALIILNERRVTQLTRFVQRGGHLVLTVRCGMKDETNALLPMRQPGSLAKLAGVEVEAYYALTKPVPLHGKLFSGESCLWAERLRILDENGYTQVMARYGRSNGWLDDQISITANAFGQGMVYTIGAYLDEAAQTALLKHIVDFRGIRPLLEAPPGIELCRRQTADGQTVDILINHATEPQHITFPYPVYDHITQQPLSGTMTLYPYVVALLTQQEERGMENSERGILHSEFRTPHSALTKGGSK